MVSRAGIGANATGIGLGTTANWSGLKTGVGVQGEAARQQPGFLGRTVAKSVVGPVADSTSGAARFGSTGRVTLASGRFASTHPVHMDLALRRVFTGNHLAAATAAVLGFAVSANAFAGEFQVPQFDSGKEVYVERGGYDFSTRMLEKAAAEDGKHTYVVIAWDLNEWNAHRTEEAADAIFRTWEGQSGFDPDQSLVIVLDNNAGVSGEGRAITLEPHRGGFYDKGLGFNKDTRVTDEMLDRHFMDNMRAGYGMDSSLASLVNGISVELDRRLLPIEQGLSGVVGAVRDDQLHAEFVSSDMSGELKDTLEQAKRVLERKDYSEMGAVEQKLRSLVEKLRLQLSERTKVREDLSHAIETYDRLVQNQEYAPQDVSRLLDSKVDRARTLVSGNQFSVMSQLYGEIAAALGPVQHKIEQRVEARSNLRSAIREARQVLGHSELDDNLDQPSTLRGHVDQAESLVTGEDFKAIQQIQSKLQSETGRIGSAIQSRIQIRQAIAEAQAKIAKDAQGMTDLLSEQVELFEGVDVSEYRSTIDKAGQAPDLTDVASLQKLRDEVAAQHVALQSEVTRLEAEAHAKTVSMALLLLVLGSVTAAAAFALIRKLNQLVQKRKEFDDREKSWNDKLDRYAQDYTTFELEKDKIKKLAVKEGETKKLYDDIVDTMDAIEIRRAALAEHLRAMRAKRNASSIANMQAIDDALSGVNQKFTFQVEQDLNKRLFRDRHEVSVDINPLQFESEMNALYEKLDGKTVSENEKTEGLWQQALFVLEATNPLTNARKDFPAIEFGKLKRQIETLGIPAEWLSRHPLYDAESKYNELNMVRMKDPARYVRTIRENLRAEELMAQQTLQVIAFVNMVKKAEQAEAQIVIDYAATVLSEAEDPRVKVKEAKLLEAEFMTLLGQSESDLKRLEIKSAEILKVYAEAETKKRVLADAIATAANAVTTAAQQVIATEAHLENAIQRYTLMQSTHDEASLKPAQVEIQDAKLDLARAKDVLAMAQKQMQAEPKNHMLAKAKAEEVLRHLKNTAEDIEEAHERIDEVEGFRKEYEAYYARLPQILETQKRVEMNSYGQFAKPVLFQKGIEYRESLPADTQSVLAAAKAPVNWQEQLRKLQRTEQMWDRAIEIVRNTKAFHDADAKINGLEQQLAEVRARLESVARYHDEAVIALAWKEFREAEAVVVEADRLRDEAAAVVGQGDFASGLRNTYHPLPDLLSREALMGEPDISAARLSAEAQALYQQAQKEIEDVYAEIKRQEEARKNYEAQYRALKQRRASGGHYASQLSQYGSYGNVEVYQQGDRIWGGLPSSAEQKLNWILLLAQLQQVQQNWDSGLARARREWDEEQERIRQERARQARLEAERRAREQAAREAAEAVSRMARQASYSSSSGSSSWGGSDSSSSRSSTRSSGGESSSSSRGSTRSIGGGGGGSRGSTRSGF